MSVGLVWIWDLGCDGPSGEVEGYHSTQIDAMRGLLTYAGPKVDEMGYDDNFVVQAEAGMIDGK